MSGTRLPLSPSPRLAAVILALHLAAGAAAWAALTGVAGAALCAALGALGLAAALDRALLRTRRCVRALEIGTDTVTVELADGSRLEATAAPGRYVTRFAVFVPLRRPVGRSLLVTADMLDEEGFRALRLWALWGRLPGPRAEGVAGAQLEG